MKIPERFWKPSSKRETTLRIERTDGRVEYLDVQIEEVIALDLEKFVESFRIWSGKRRVWDMYRPSLEDL